MIGNYKFLLLLLPLIASCSSGSTSTSISTSKSSEIISSSEVKSTSNSTISSTSEDKISKEKVNSFDKKYINLFGRTWTKSNKLVLDHNGTGFEVFFKGSKLKCNFTAGITTNYIRVIIDDSDEEKYLSIAKNGLVYLANELDEGEHKVRVIKISSTAAGQLSVSDIDTDGEFLFPKNERKFGIEFIGDSITCGAGVTAKSSAEAPTFKNSDVTKAYSFLTAESLNAYSSIVSTEGICVKASEWVDLPMLEMYKTYSLNNRSKYDFNDSFDVCVVALGTNDASYLSAHPDYESQFKLDYIDLLSLIREKRPNANIVCVYGMMNKNNKIENGINAAIQEMEDSKISYKALSKDIQGAGSHPGIEGAKKQAKELVDYINSLFK